MANPFSLLARGFRSVFQKRPKPPKMPPRGTQRGPGHRGIAAGSLKHRQQLQEQGKQPYTAEEIGKWRTLTGEEIDAFLYDGHPLFVNSSNVVLVQYIPEVNKMMCEFKNGSAYLYSNISHAEAESFAYAHSKGSWVWTNLRVRGSATMHKKPYVKIR